MSPTGAKSEYPTPTRDRQAKGQDYDEALPQSTQERNPTATSTKRTKPRRRTLPSPDKKDLGRDTYRGKGGAELQERRRFPSPDKNRKRAATSNQKVETRKSRRTRRETLDSPNERISAYMHPAKSNEQRELDKKVPRKRAVRDDRARPETNEARSPKSRAGDELPTELPRVRRADVEAEKEDEASVGTHTSTLTRFPNRSRKPSTTGCKRSSAEAAG
jgi:hypothetical protein